MAYVCQIRMNHYRHVYRVHNLIMSKSAGAETRRRRAGPHTNTSSNPIISRPTRIRKITNPRFQQVLIIASYLRSRGRSAGIAWRRCQGYSWPSADARAAPRRKHHAIYWRKMWTIELSAGESPDRNVSASKTKINLTAFGPEAEDYFRALHRIASSIFFVRVLTVNKFV